MQAQGGGAAWVRAANPFVPIESQDQARRAARIGAFGCVLAAVSGGVQALQMLAQPERMALAMRAALTAQPEAAADPEFMAVMEPMLTAMPGWIAMASLAFCVVYLGLAAFQWVRPNVVVPAILLALTLYGGFSALQTQIAQPELAVYLAQPAWTWVALVLTAVLLGIGVRGGWRLHQLRIGER